MEKINYSVIIPTRNIPQLLERCLASIPERKDLQVIIVDDNSDPGIVDFDHYPGLERKDVQVVFTKEGRGAGYARNVGVEKAQGKWLVFADSDDYFLPSFNSVLDQYADDEADILFFDVDSVYSDTLAPSPRHLAKSKALNGMNGPKLDRYCRYKYTEPWGKFIKRALVVERGIKFDESPVANDYMFSIKTGHFATSVQYVPVVLYCLTTRPGSLSFQKADSESKVMTRLSVYDGVQRFLDEEKVGIRPFSEFAISTWLNSPGYRKIISGYCRERGRSFFKVFLEYCKEKFRIMSAGF